MTGRAPLAIATLLAVALLSPAAAQEPRAALDGSLATGLAESEVGVNFGLGASVATQRVAFRAQGNLHLVGSEDGDYEWDLASDGPVCRDERSGQEVSSGNCSFSRALLALMSDVSFVIPAFRGALHLGGGYRAGDGSTFYGAAGYAFRPGRSSIDFLARGIVGSDLLLLQVVVSLPLSFEP